MSNNMVQLTSLKIPETTKLSAQKVLSNSVDFLGKGKIQQHIFIWTWPSYSI